MAARMNKSASLKAREALDVSDRKIASLEHRIEVNESMHAALQSDMTRVTAEREYLSHNPALLVDEVESEVLDPAEDEELADEEVSQPIA